MKLLFVHQNLGEFGGAEANIHLAAKELRRRGHTLALLFRDRTGRSEEVWRGLLDQCFALPARANPEFIEAVLEQFGPDLIYLHTLADLEAVEALLNSSLPVVRMVHDHSLYCLRQYKYNYFTRRICTRSTSAYCVFPCLANFARNSQGGWPVKWVSYARKKQELALNRRCAAVIVYSEYVKDELVRNGFAREKLGICVPVRQDNAEGEVSSFSSRSLVLYAGQIIRGKGVDALLQALAKVPVPFEGLILGDGNHRRDCEKLCARLGLANRVRFHGYVLPAELKGFYLEASAFVMSSLWPEPFGLAGPEAMVYGLPVVAFDAGAIREWLHDGVNGFLVPWNDTDGFAARLTELLTNKELGRQMGLRGKEWVKSHAAAPQINKLESLFERVLHQARAKANQATFQVDTVAYD